MKKFNKTMKNNHHKMFPKALSNHFLQDRIIQILHKKNNRKKVRDQIIPI